MKHTNQIKIIFFILLSSIILNCEVDDSSIVESVYFVANFTNDWIESDTDGFIVITDLEGNIMAFSKFNGNTQIAFDNEFTMRIIVTTGIKHPDNNSVYLTSNCYVNPGEWTWKGLPKIEYKGDVNLQFINEPAGLDWFLISGQNHSSVLSELTEEITFPLFVSEDDLYLFWAWDNPRYLWIENVSPGEIHSVDLSNLKTTTYSETDLPDGTSHFLIQFYGHHIPGEFYQGSYYIDSHEMFGEESMSSYNVQHPIETTDFTTMIYIFDSPDHWNGDYWTNFNFGPVPSSYQNIEADFTIVNAQPDSINIDIESTVDNVLLNWVAYHDSTEILWRVFTHPEFTDFKLPRLPENISALFNLPNNQLFTLKNVQIMDYPDLENHDEVIKTLFQSEDYFFNIANKGVKIRTKQNNNYKKIDEANLLKHNDPMLPIPPN
jgi:hypothetical protein